MQLDTITTNIRNRTPWEAIDLGFAMVRAWWISIYTPLAILLLSIITLLLLVIPYEYYWVSLLVLWWLKPLYHRLILHVISHQVFGESLSWSTTLKALPDLMLRTGLLSELTWRRFSLSRGFRLPVWQLERLRGKPRSARQQLLLGHVHTAAIWLNIAIFSFQIILSISFLMLIWLFIPEYYADDLFYKLISNQLSGIGYSVEVIMVMGFVMVMVFLEPYYIAASFALYLNRRTQLEAWDIELDFRKMAARLDPLIHKLSVLIIAATLTFSIIGLTPNPVRANESDNPTVTTHDFIEHLATSRLPAEDATRVIREVMQNEHLRQEEATMRWRWKDNDETPDATPAPPWLASFAEVFAVFVEYALWFTIAIGIVMLLIYRDRWLPLLVRQPDVKEALRPDILFGMDVRKESLPDDVVSAARKRWQQGNAREALSLLYRCALVQLINQDKLPLEHSHTEGDILTLSRSVLTDARHRYLTRLTQNWVKIAYAHESPTDAEMNHLLDHWMQGFAARTNEVHA